MSITALSVRGNKFVDADSNIVQLRGTNNIGTHFGCLTIQPIDPVFREVPFSLASLKIMHDTWNMNCVRVVINAGCWLNCCVSPVTFGATYQNAILAYIDNINTAGMYAVVCLFNTASGTGEMADTSATNFWNSIGPMLVNRPLVLLEAYNEPHTITLWSTWKNGGTEAGLLSYASVGMQSLVTTIRATGCTQPILLDGMSFAGDFTSFATSIPTDPLNNLGASWHMYSNWPNTDIDNIGGYSSRLNAVAAIYPVVCTEFGGSASGDVTFNQKYYMELLRYCDVMGIGYMSWAWTQGSGIFLLSDYTAFTPSQYGVAYYQHLRQGTQKDSQRDTRQQVIPSLAW